MTTIEEIQQAIRQLSRFQREDLAEWMLNSADFDHRVKEPAAAYVGTIVDRRMSLEEFLQMEDDSVRYEYIAGQIFAMSPPTLRHEGIVSTLFLSIGTHLAGGPG